MLADPVALLFVTRHELDVFARLPELVVGGLNDRDAGGLLDSQISFVLDHDVRRTDRCRGARQSAGPPGATAGLFLGPDCRRVRTAGRGPVSVRIEERFRERLNALPEDARVLLLVAAAEPVGNPSVVLRAARSLGIGLSDVAAAEDLLRIEARVTFRHPLVRSAAYYASSEEERRAAHRALAEATDAEVRSRPAGLASGPGGLRS